MKKHVFAFVALAATFAVGASLNSRPATAEAAPSQGPSQVWQLGVANAGTAWRLNTATGFMELCSDVGGSPRCDAMPAPGATSAPKGLLVPAPAGR
jgi:hypothetical protein